jgi:alkylated DNA repair dioxygenase AlkB
MKKTIFNIPDAELTLYEDFFSKEESNNIYKELTETIQWQQEQVKMFGKAIDEPRLTALYGDQGKSYTYSGKTMRPKSWSAALKLIKERIEKETGVEFNSCLLNLYRNGKDSNGWHQDNEKELVKEPIIASISFGETRPFQLKHIENKALDKIHIPLTHGSFLLMKGTTQHKWKHQIPKTTKQIDPRINLTFRVIKDELNSALPAG